MSYKFDVCAIDKSFNTAVASLKKEETSEGVFNTITDGDLEQVCDIPGPICVGKVPGLMHQARTCFAKHYPLVLDPDSVWLTLERGLSIHINENAEELRNQFVDFEGKVFIEVRRDFFVRGQKNDWEGVFPEFSEKIGEYIGKKRNLLVSDFSTTTQMSKIASEIVLMDSMKSYFDYGVKTMCGISSVEMEGKVEDWENIKERMLATSEFGLSWWLDKLTPVLDEFINSAKGNPNIDFWKSWYNEGGGSGGPYLGGHCSTLYPYLEAYDGSYHKNRFAWGTFKGSSPESFPKGISSVPFVWNYHGTMISMEFVGGIIGLEETPKGLRNCFGWAVREASVPLGNYAVENITNKTVVCDKNGNSGTVKEVEVQTYSKSRSIGSITIDWNGTGIKKHGPYQLAGLYIKGEH